MAFSGRKVVPDISQALVDKAEEMNWLAWGGTDCPPLTNTDGSPILNERGLPVTSEYLLFTSPGAAWLRELRDLCLAKINMKNMSMSALTSANVNGESFTREIAIDAAAMLDQVNTALREVLGTEIRMTFSLFSNIPH